MKRAVGIFLSIIMVMSFSGVAFAHDVRSDVCTHSDFCTHQVVDEGFEYEKEVVVEVRSEEEMLRYPRNLNYRYTFIIPIPQATRAVCYMCGRSTMGLANVREEWSRVAKSCPMNQWGDLDHFMTDKNYQVERCTACGYRVKVKDYANTYRSLCRNSGMYDDIEYEVRPEWYMSNGHDIHEVYVYWVYGIYQ